MRFSQVLRDEADPIFEAIFHHPFVVGIATGKLRPEQLIHYVSQDFQYLNAFIRIYGLALSKCKDRKDMEMFSQQIGFILNAETHPHNNFCRIANVRYEDLQGYSLLPTAHHYINHMLTVAHEGSVGEILAVLLPCPWTYFEIGQKLKNEIKPDENHPFFEWITFYADERVGDVTKRFCDRMDDWAETASRLEKNRMKNHFILSCQLEYSFWEMAYGLERWPVTEGTVSIGSGTRL